MFESIKNFWNKMYQKIRNDDDGGIGCKNPIVVSAPSTSEGKPPTLVKLTDYDAVKKIHFKSPRGLLDEIW